MKTRFKVGDKVRLNPAWQKMAATYDHALNDYKASHVGTIVRVGEKMSNGLPVYSTTGLNGKKDNREKAFNCCWLQPHDQDEFDLEGGKVHDESRILTFSQFLENTKEWHKEGPVHDHDCTACEYLGTDIPRHPNERQSNAVDMYVHKNPSGIWTVLRRYSSDGPQYSSTDIEYAIDPKWAPHFEILGKVQPTEHPQVARERAAWERFRKSKGR